jgi:hypothetical protein
MKTRGYSKQVLLLAALLLADAGYAQYGGQGADDVQTDDQTVCITESGTLNTNANISTATLDLMTTAKDDILADFTQFCRVISLTCTADIADYSGDLRAVCEAENGQLARRDYQLACKTDTASPIEIPGTVKLLNLPACVGASCDVNNLPPSLTQILDDVVVALNVEVDAALGDKVECQVDTEASGASSAPTLLSRHAWNMFVGTLSLVAFLSWSC